jgi:hypothetical protein
MTKSWSSASATQLLYADIRVWLVAKNGVVNLERSAQIKALRSKTRPNLLLG